MVGHTGDGDSSVVILVENSRLLEYVDEVLQQQLVVDADQQRRASIIVIYQRQTDQPPTDLAVSMKLINHSPVYRHVNDENTGACISCYKLPTCLVLVLSVFCHPRSEG